MYEYQIQGETNGSTPWLMWSVLGLRLLMPVLLYLDVEDAYLQTMVKTSR